MHPVLFTLPNGFAIHTYGVLLAAAILFPVLLIDRWAKRANYPENFGADISLLVFGGAILGSRLEYVRVNWHRFADDPLQVFNLRSGGLVFYGGLIFVVASLLIYARVKKLRTLHMLDLVAPVLPLGQAIGRVACFSAGCCYGRPTDVPWAVTFSNPDSLAPRDIPIHPTQLYEVGYSLLLAAFLFWMRGRKKFDGTLLLIYFSVYPLLRSTNELFRADVQRGWFLESVLGERITNAQFISLCLLIAVSVGWYLIPRRLAKAGQARKDAPD